MAARFRNLVTAALIVMLFGLWTADSMVRHSKPSHPAPGPLSMPARAGEWIGQPIPIRPEDAALIPRTSIRMQRYARRNDNLLYAIDVAAVSARDVSAFHNPESCYRAAGWSIIDKQQERIPLQQSAPTLLIERILLQKGGYRMHVLYWYAVTGNVSGALGSAHPSRIGVLLGALRSGSSQSTTFLRLNTLAVDGEVQSLHRSIRFLRALIEAMQKPQGTQLVGEENTG